FIRTAIDMDKNRAFSQRLRQSVTDYFDNPWLLTYADADRLVDMRDEALILRDDEVTGIVPGELEFEELDLVNDELADRVAEMLSAHKATGAPINLSALLKDYLTQHPLAYHFDLARIVIDQAVRMGYSEDDFNAIQPDWEAINDYGAKVQANVINKY
ncbi:condensin subunit MukF, partial [Photobacterium damselae]